MTIITFKIQRRGLLLTLHLLLQTVTRMNAILIIKKSSTSVTFHLDSSDSQFPSSQQENQSPAPSQTADKLQEVALAAFSEKTMTDYFSIGYCNYSDVGTIETLNTLDPTTKIGSCGYILLNVSLSNLQKKLNKNSLK